MSFGSVCGKILVRGTGAVALGLVARDAHHYGKIQADCDMKTKDAKACQYYLENTMSLNKPSHTKNKMQQRVLKFELNNGIRGFFNSCIGYFKGFFGNIVSDVIPFGLGLIALLSKGRAGGLGLPAKLSAAGLAIFSAFSFMKDGLGIGKNKPKL